mgnify:CR=1 FL=1
MIRYVMTTLLAFILVFSAAGCGKKGNLEDPKEEKIQYPRQYPR